MRLSQHPGVNAFAVNQCNTLVDEAAWVVQHPGGTVTCRPLQSDEAFMAAAIEATRFQPSTSVSTFESVISGQNGICCGIFMNETLVGCAAANITPALDGFASEAFFDNVSILAEHSGCGLGLMLTAYLIKLCSGLPHRCSRATLEVRIGNVAAKRIYSRIGFTCHGIRKRYYSLPTEDAEIHWLENMQSPEFRVVLLASVAHALELFHVKQLQRSEADS
jgi:ribosomal-protein-alanine N-acetyltransferase